MRVDSIVWAVTRAVRRQSRGRGIVSIPGRRCKYEKEGGEGVLIAFRGPIYMPVPPPG